MEAWSYELPPALAAVRPAASAFRQWASATANDAAAADCELALVEACNNLLTHNQSIPGLIQIQAEATPVELTLTIRDQTPGFEWPAEPALPPANEEAGRGIFLMHALMTQVEYRRSPDGNELRLKRQL